MGVESRSPRSKSGGGAEEARRRRGGDAEGNVRAMAQDGPKSFQRRPVRSQDADALKTPPRLPQDALRDPKKLPGGPQVGPKTGFWEMFKSKMEPSWVPQMHQVRKCLKYKKSTLAAASFFL